MNDTYVTFAGWVGTDVSLRHVSGGHQVATFRVGSTPSRMKDGQWQDGPTNWFTVTAWGRLAHHLSLSLRQGDPVLVHGRLQADVWEKDDGSTSTRYVVTATSVGHDLTRGMSTYRKVSGPSTERSEQRDPWAVTAPPAAGPTTPADTAPAAASDTGHPAPAEVDQPAA